MLELLIDRICDALCIILLAYAWQLSTERFHRPAHLPQPLEYPTKIRPLGPFRIYPERIKQTPGIFWFPSPEYDEDPDTIVV